MRRRVPTPHRRAPPQKVFALRDCGASKVAKVGSGRGSNLLKYETAGGVSQKGLRSTKRSSLRGRTGGAGTAAATVSQGRFSSSRVARRKMYLVRFGIGDGFLQQPSWALRPAARLFLHAAALPLGGLPCCGPCSCGSRLFTLARSTLGTPNHSPSVLRHIALSRCPSFI